MTQSVTAAILIPFFGTSLGACAVFFLRREMPESLTRACSGFAAGVMTAASVWSLLLPAMEQAAEGGAAALLPVAGGFCAGIAAMLLTERAAGFLFRRRNGALSGTAFLVLAVTLHNIPEGLAVGVACAGLREHVGTVAGVTALSLGVALQNIPEGSIISLPLRAQGRGKAGSFLCGALSGAVEPVAAVAALLAAAPIGRMMPFFLSLAAGAMVHVTVQELIPEAVTERSRLGSIAFSAGFVLMMAMDVML